MFSSYQSRHHSHTLPCMSNRPNALGLNDPAGMVLSRFSPFSELPGLVSPLKFESTLEIVSPVLNADVVLARHGATVLIDTVSLQYLAGSEIDFVDDLIGASFKVNNPQAKASCGCGTSFSL